MPLLVDASNVLHVTGVLPPELAGPDELALAELVARSRWGRDFVLVVSDGGVPGDRRPFPALGIVLRSTGARSADEVIVEEAKRSSFARRITVVTNDRALLAATTRLGCRSMSSVDFLSALANDAEKPGRAEPRRASLDRPGATERLDAASVERWMREFGFDPPSSTEGARP